MRKVYSRGYTNPAPTREPGAVPVPIEDLALQAGNYRVDLQYDQLQPRDIDPSAILRKSEGQLMECLNHCVHMIDRIGEHQMSPSL